MGEGKRLDSKRMDQFKDWARCHEAVHPGELLKHIAALEGELARLKPSGQVAEDEKTVRTALQVLEKRTGQSYQNAADANICLAAKAQGYESTVAERDALAKFKAYVHQRLDEAAVPTHPNGPHSAAGCRIGDRMDILVAERDAAVAANAALLKRLGDVQSMVFTLRIDGHEGDEETGVHEPDCGRCARDGIEAAVADALSGPHPGAALLAQHREALVRARNEGLEKAAALADNAAQGARLLRANMQTSVMRTAQDKAAETASDLAALIRREKEPEQ